MSAGEARTRVALLGATGVVGQRLVRRLAGHPELELVALAASPRSAGRSYREAVRWLLPDPIPAEVAEMPVVAVDELVDRPGAELLLPL
jgi:aspartate-semialdehyde dehydrogenase